MRPIDTDVARFVVCMCVCVCVGHRLSFAKTDEPIEMPFGATESSVGSKNHALDEGCILEPPGEYN